MTKLPNEQIKRSGKANDGSGRAISALLEHQLPRVDASSELSKNRSRSEGVKRFWSNFL